MKFDPASAAPLMGAFMQNGVVIDQAALGALMATSPGLDKVKEFAKAAVEGANLEAGPKEALLTMVDGLKGKEEAVPSASVEGQENEQEEKKELREENVFIGDVGRFKGGLKGSGAAVPLEAIGEVV